VCYLKLGCEEFSEMLEECSNQNAIRMVGGFVQRNVRPEFLAFQFDCMNGLHMNSFFETKNFSVLLFEGTNIGFAQH